MALAMSRPVKHPKTGVYWLRKRVPGDVAAVVGRQLITRKLGTKNPEEAKRRHAEILAGLEAEWATIRIKGKIVTVDSSDDQSLGAGFDGAGRQITDGEAHGFATSIHDE